MAVKPLAQPEIWASNALYTTGPFIGSASKVVPAAGIAAEGHRPGANFPTPAEYENSQQNAITLLSQWTFAGSFSGAPDAHIVETDGTGRSTLHGLTVTNTTTQTPVFATGNGVLAPVFRATNPNGGDGYVANLSGSTGSAFYSEISNDSKGVEIEMDGVTFTNGVGILVTADATTTTEALTITHAGTTNNAASITATGASCMALRLEANDDAGLFVEGGVTGSAAILALGKVDAAGVRGSGGPSGGNGVEGSGTGSSSAGVYGLASARGVYGQATDSVAGVGVYGVTSNAAGLGGAAGVQGDGLNTAPGVMGTAVNGYGGMFTADGARQTVFMTPRIADPSSTLTGGLWNRLNIGLSTFVANAARRLWHTAGGASIKWDSDLTGGTVDDTPTVILTCNLTGADTPVVAGVVWILFTMEVGRTSGTPNLNIQIGDDVGDPPPNYPISEVVQLFQTAGAGVYERHVAYLVPYQLPAIGTRQFSATIWSTVGGQDLNWRNAAMAILGVF